MKKSLNFDVGRGNVCLSKKFCENIQGHFGHLTCKDVNVIFEVFEGILVILHESSRVEIIWNLRGIMVFSNFQDILLKRVFWSFDV